MLYIGKQFNEWFDGTLTRYVKPKNNYCAFKKTIR